MMSKGPKAQPDWRTNTINLIGNNGYILDLIILKDDEMNG